MAVHGDREYEHKDNRLVWDQAGGPDGAGGYVDISTGETLPTWDDALDELGQDQEAEPLHVVRTLPELKERMGHASDRAAMIYLHATEERHQEIADVLSAMAKTQLKKPKKAKYKKAPGTERARKGQRKA